MAHLKAELEAELEVAGSIIGMGVELIDNQNKLKRLIQFEFQARQWQQRRPLGLVWR